MQFQGRRTQRENASLNKFKPALIVPTITENAFLHKLLKTKSFNINQSSGTSSWVATPIFNSSGTGYTMTFTLPTNAEPTLAENVNLTTVSSANQQRVTLSRDSNNVYTLNLSLYVPPGSAGDKGDRGERGLKGDKGDKETEENVD